MEDHQKNIILNTSASHPFKTPATAPTEFYSNFLPKKSQFKAKELLSHHFMIEKICFNPGASFITCLWNAKFFWILPDSPSGVSIFHCPEHKSLNATKLEKECIFASINKVKANNLEKLSKQNYTYLRLSWIWSL
jgi:hypothetical protein